MEVSYSFYLRSQLVSHDIWAYLLPLWIPNILYYHCCIFVIEGLRVNFWSFSISHQILYHHQKFDKIRVE